MTSTVHLHPHRDHQLKNPSRTFISHLDSTLQFSLRIWRAHQRARIALPSVDESEGNVEVARRKTIAERMAKLGGIERCGTEESIDPEQPAPGEQDEEEEEQARRQRIAARIAGMGGMRVGMLPTQPGMGVVPPRTPPPVPSRPNEEATPRSPPHAITPAHQPAAYYYESDQDYEHPSSSDDGAQVEAEESELEEQSLEHPPPPPPRSTRPPVPVARPAAPKLNTGTKAVRRTATHTGRSGSFDTITSIPRPPPRQATSDFVMVEAEEAQPAPPPRPPRGPPPVPMPVPVWSSHLPPESSDLAGTGQWELPSIPSGGLDLGHSIADLSGSMWSDDSTAYPPASLSPPPPPPPTGAPPQPMGQPVRAPSRVKHPDHLLRRAISCSVVLHDQRDHKNSVFQNAPPSLVNSWIGSKAEPGQEGGRRKARHH
ncbi:hypothetical protein BC826DRAFT_1113370 [Russula brevipes]|nr:hypothetical protein BC826DRAFT_1113370 [Russula brevipes]